MREVGVMYTGLMAVYSFPLPTLPCQSPKSVPPLRARLMTISSRLAFPARSPIPLIVHSSCRAPFRAPLRLFAVDSPRSFWQCVLNTTSSAPGTFSRRYRMSSPNSHGMFHPVVSGMLRVVAPAKMVASSTRHRNTGSLRPASSGLNSTSSHPSDRAYSTARTAISTTSSGVFFSFDVMWISDVAMNVWIRGRIAPLMASHARRMSFSFARLSPQMTGT
mmetsp:Transcript_352/g.833  ORF Transcript_352/g.833 Transcript_352/m.833 type:complete len:219 (+) Transcript_352:944-1600(+)